MNTDATSKALPFAIFAAIALFIVLVDIVFGYGGFSSAPWQLRGFLNTTWFAESVAAIGTASIVFYFRKKLPYALPWIWTGATVAIFCLWVLVYNAITGRLGPNEYITHYWEMAYIILHSVIGPSTPFRPMGDYFLTSDQLLFAVTQIFVVMPLLGGYLYALRKRK